MTLKNAFEDLAVSSKQDTEIARLTARYGGGKVPVVATVTTVGDTVVHTPAAGKAIRLFWVNAINKDPNNDPTIKILIGSQEFYRVVAVSHWEPFEGIANATMKVNLSTTASVEFTAHIQEFTP